MPGRDELIQQNIARARANSQAAQPQETVGQGPSVSGQASPFSPSGSAPRSFFGGNLDVYSALERIQFQGIAGDASMRGNVAYIRIWKRPGTAQQSSAAQEAAVNPQVDVQEQISQEIDERFGPERENLGDDQFIEYTVGESSYSVITGNVERDEDGYIIGDGTIETTFFPGGTSSFQEAFDRQQALGTQTPSLGTSTPTSSNVAAPQTQGGSSAPTPTPVGGLRSANPGGFLSTLGKIGTNVGRSLLGLPPGYSGGARGTGSPASLPTGEMMWQFLFNPSELELEVGPEFKNAETWGVSDTGNSGQPLHWSHNKNALLKFNSVLLNGFIFGRKVEVLEQGLIELFMARDGEGQHGPHVLEFVWGKRVFGPCVIKNINVKEKMWDEGEVVNAELSFTLEQVPEWTINDGFVDVARPGRIGLQGDPTDPTSSPSSPNDNSNQPPNTPAPDPAPSSQKPTGPSVQFCTQATNAYSNFNKLGSQSTQSWTDDLFNANVDRVRGLATQYQNLIVANRSIINSVKGVDPKCANGCAGTRTNNSLLSCVRQCSYQVASKIQGSYLDDKSCVKPQFITPR